MSSLCRTIRRNGHFIAPRKVKRFKSKGDGNAFREYAKAMVMRLVDLVKNGW